MSAPHPFGSDREACAWLPALAEVAAGVEPPGDAPTVGRTAARWARERDLVGPAYAWAKRLDPALAEALRADALGAAAATGLHLRTVDEVERRLAAAGIEMALLKGAATASWAYADPSLRPMTDIDVWVRPESMEPATACLLELGFRRDPGLAARPDALQRESGGERIFVAARGGAARVELHYSPFQGWWTRRTAVPDVEGTWGRSEPLGPGRHARRLAAEDAVIQAAVHAVAGQFSQAPLRGLLDIAVIARRTPVDWGAVASRAERWRLRVGVWLALEAAEGLYRVPGARETIERLRPRAARRALLLGLVGPAALLRGEDAGSGHRRRLFLLTVADRARDAARLAGRTLWPEPWWLEARYGRPMGRLGHLREMIRDGRRGG